MIKLTILKYQKDYRIQTIRYVILFIFVLISFIFMFRIVSRWKYYAFKFLKRCLLRTLERYWIKCKFKWIWIIDKKMGNEFSRFNPIIVRFEVRNANKWEYCEGRNW